MHACKTHAQQLGSQLRCLILRPLPRAAAAMAASPALQQLEWRLLFVTLTGSAPEVPGAGSEESAAYDGECFCLAGRARSCVGS